MHIFSQAYPENFSFFILGVGRSGTSLLAGLLDSHSKIEVGFEHHADECLRGKDLPENRRTMFSDRAGNFIQRCIDEAKASKTPLWGNKITTEQLAGLNKHNLFNVPPIDILEVFFRDYIKDTKVIHLLRDGIACIASKLRRTPQSLEQACNSWLYGVEVYEFLQQRPNTLLLCYEQLVSEPTKTLQDICQFLDVEFEELMLEGTMTQRLWTESP